MKKTLSELKPINGPDFITQDLCTRVSPSKVSRAKVGGKAYGLTCLPKQWTLPFVIISGELYSQYKTAYREERPEILDNWLPILFESAIANSILPGDRVIIRSSACDEFLDAKGEYYSSTGRLNTLVDPLRQCLEQLVGDGELYSQKIPLILQKHSAITSAKGHLSNEIRFSKEMRDWLIEFERPNDFTGVRKRISIRKWRKDITSEVNPAGGMPCTNFANIVESLKAPAAWAYRSQLRVHFEWVWDGDGVYLVQADNDINEDGINPSSLKPQSQRHFVEYAPRCLQVVDPNIPTEYNKIHNVHLYHQLGLTTTKLFMLKDRGVITDLINGKIADDLRHDLEHLASGSLVVRMDVATNDKRIRQLLPRTNEVRGLEATLNWFSENRGEIAQLLEFDLALILHNFIPSVSSAFAYAIPGQRKVKVEALWGLPEGLYYFSHDKYVIDTGNSLLHAISDHNYLNFYVERSENFKKRIVAPDENGDWITKTLASSNGWGGVFKKKDDCSLAYIAHMTRKIAEKEQKAVSVMWFVGVDESVSPNGLIPWYHEPADDNPRRASASYRRKTLFDKEFVIKTTADLDRLKEEASKPTRVRFICIQPQEDKLLRSKEIIKEIGELAQSIKAVIYLEGGTLSHAYYQLEKTGAQVQVALPFEGKEDKREFNKLVRDKIPSKIEGGGEKVKKAKFSGEYLRRLLKEKLIEEAFEVLDANGREEMLEELADVSAVIDGLLLNIKADRNELVETQRLKEEKAGGFSEGYVLLETDNPLSKKDESSPLLGLLGLGSPVGTTATDFYEVIENNHAIKKWFDKREHKPETEALFDLVIPVVKDEWEEKAPETFFAISGDYAIRAKVTGKRQGAKLKIRFSVYTLPKQLKLFS